jgi:glycosyltransferase involved in cell wall biosynthesis
LSGFVGRVSKVMNSKDQEFAEVIAIKPATEFQREFEKRPPTGRAAAPPAEAYVRPAPPANPPSKVRRSESFVHPIQAPSGRPSQRQPLETPALEVYTQPVPPPQFRVDRATEPLPNTKSLRAEAAAEYYTMPKVKPFTRPLRVLHITNVETSNPYLNNLCDFTDRRAITYLAATLGKEGSFTKDLDRRGVQVYALDCRQRIRYPKALYQLCQIIQKERVDIVHTHLIDPTLVGMLAAKLRHRGVVVTRHHTDVLYHLPSKFKRDLYLRLDDWVNRNADHLIAPSQMVQELLTRREHVPESKVSLIPYGQTLERFDAVKPEMVQKVRAELGMKERLALVCVARLHWEKGHRFLLEAFALMCDEGLDANLYLVGNGPDHELLANLARELDVEQRVKFLGWRDDALVILAAADIVVHAAVQETLPAVVIEALMLERPLVVTDVSGVRDLIGNSKHGMLIPPRNSEALHAALSWTVHNLAQAQARAQEGRRFILEYMSAERVAREYFNVYRRVMRDHLQKTVVKAGKISADTRQILEEAE